MRTSDNECMLLLVASQLLIAAHSTQGAIGKRLHCRAALLLDEADAEHKERAAHPAYTAEIELRELRLDPPSSLDEAATAVVDAVAPHPGEECAGATGVTGGVIPAVVDAFEPIK